MVKKILIGVGALVLLAAIAAGLLVREVMHLRDQKLDDRLHVFLNKASGNSAVLLTAEGAVVVDTKMWRAASSMLDDIRALGAPAIRAIVNTHHHPDHTHGNPLYPRGTPVYAALPVTALLQRFDQKFWADEPARGLMPNRPFESQTEIDFGEDVLRLVQLPPSHTGGGDAAVLFVKRRVVLGGDVFINGFYPNIDRASGGSAKGYVDALDKLLELPFDVAVPGHGPVGKRADVEKCRAFHVALWNYARKAAAAGRTPAQAADEAPAELRGLENVLVFTSLEKALAAAIDEAR